MQTRNAFGYSVLHMACGAGCGLGTGDGASDNTATVRTALDYGADVNARGGSFARSPLHVACTRGSLGTVEMLLAAGADVNARDGDGYTALMLLCDNRQGDVGMLIAQALLAHTRLELGARRGDGSTPEMIARRHFDTALADLIASVTSVRSVKSALEGAAGVGVMVMQCAGVVASRCTIAVFSEFPEGFRRQVHPSSIAVTRSDCDVQLAAMHPSGCVCSIVRGYVCAAHRFLWGVCASSSSGGPMCDVLGLRWLYVARQLEAGLAMLRGGCMLDSHGHRVVV